MELANSGSNTRRGLRKGKGLPRGIRCSRRRELEKQASKFCLRKEQGSEKESKKERVSEKDQRPPRKDGRENRLGLMPREEIPAGANLTVAIWSNPLWSIREISRSRLNVGNHLTSLMTQTATLTPGGLLGSARRERGGGAVGHYNRSQGQQLF